MLPSMHIGRNHQHQQEPPSHTFTFTSPIPFSQHPLHSNNTIFPILPYHSCLHSPQSPSLIWPCPMVLPLSSLRIWMLLSTRTWMPLKASLSRRTALHGSSKSTLLNVIQTCYAFGHSVSLCLYLLPSHTYQYCRLLICTLDLCLIAFLCVLVSDYKSNYFVIVHYIEK